MPNTSKLLSPFRLGRLELKNRMVMAPMTRSRAVGDGNVPNPLAAPYYAQRASAGLLITEATQVSPQGVGYIRTPGMHSPEQVAGWRKVTEAVHAAGGILFAQLWHVGRVSHPDFHDGRLPVAPSAIGYEGEVFTFQGKKRVVTPRALETEELPGVVEQFRRAAENAREAGFDGVELHGSNGYLLDQFLRDGSNQRTDAYGGSIENRARFPLEMARAVVGVWGSERVGYRLAPQSFPYAGVTDSTPAETFTHMARELSRLGLGYLHVTEAVSGKDVPSPEQRISPLLRKAFQGAFIVNGGYDARTGEEAIALGEADLVAYGVPFLANPDLPERFRHEAALNPVDASTFFTGEEKGYTDYPTLR
ncbi:alkene reductase [Pyxidicoccus xibeiensis]|uniref:alkene reductase n=1 Tax=Pyxidicoccus xibeiensis TaxID=2906759 RepID=UPI0020A8158E|nr:alkene reductase [Pyxidicoccus xibeiensis]MCP3143583.1 alkene reductase [Pyxidicoccus xibeiensis]